MVSTQGASESEKGTVHSWELICSVEANTASPSGLIHSCVTRLLKGYNTIIMVPSN